MSRKYRITNDRINHITVYVVEQRLWKILYWYPIDYFGTEKEAVEFIEERIRLEKKYS